MMMMMMMTMISREEGGGGYGPFEVGRRFFFEICRGGEGVTDLLKLEGDSYQPIQCEVCA